MKGISEGGQFTGKRGKSFFFFPLRNLCVRKKACCQGKGSGLTRAKTWDYFLAKSLTGYLNVSLNLLEISFLICKMGIIMTFPYERGEIKDDSFETF